MIVHLYGSGILAFPTLLVSCFLAWRGRGWDSIRPRTPHTQAKGAPPGHPRAAPTARKASTQERALWGW